MKKSVSRTFAVVLIIAMLVTYLNTMSFANVGEGAFFDVYSKIPNGVNNGFWFDAEGLIDETTGELVGDGDSVRGCPYVAYLRDHGTTKNISGGDRCPYYGVEEDGNTYINLNPGSYYVAFHPFEKSYKAIVDIKLDDAFVAGTFAAIRFNVDNDEGETLIGSTEIGLNVAFDVADDSKDTISIGVDGGYYVVDLPNGAFATWKTITILDNNKGIMKIYYEDNFIATVELSNASGGEYKSVIVKDATGTEKVKKTDASVSSDYNNMNFGVAQNADETVTPEGGLHFDNWGIVPYEFDATKNDPLENDVSTDENKDQSGDISSENNGTQGDIVAKTERLNLQSRGGLKQYAPHGYIDEYCLIFNYGSRYTLGTYDLADYERLEIKYATDGSFTAQQENMLQPAFLALCKDSKEIGIDGVGYADMQIQHEDKILSKADCEDAYITNEAGKNWDKNERSAIIDLTNVDYNGEITLFHFNSTGNQLLVVEVILYANGDDTVEDEAGIILPEIDDPNPAEPSREVDFDFWNEDITHVSYDKINEIYILNNIEFKEKSFLSSGVEVAVFCGWVGSLKEVSGFSYSINNGPRQSKTEFLVEAEQAVKDAAVTTGASYAYRFNIAVPVSEGSQLVKVFAEFENGEYEIIWISELTVGEATAYDPGENIYKQEIQATDFSYTIANGQVTITDYSGPAKEVIIPAKIEGYPVTSIGYWAFCDCDLLTSITIPDSVTSIGYWAFCDCDLLTSITIPDSVTSIGDYAFAVCDSLTSITVSENNTKYSSKDGVLFDKDKTTIICCPCAKNGEYTMPDSVTNIEESAFEECYLLTSITIPDSVTSIGKSAFRACSALTSITIPDSITSIESTAFYECSSLTSITIPDNVTSIEDWAFAYCSSLTSITIPDNVTSIEDWAFAYCSSLTSITIPDNVTSIGDYAFQSCYSLTGITVSENNTKYSSKDGVLFDKDKTAIICYPCAKNGEYTIPDSVTSIGDYAFESCDSLTSITIPDSVMIIGDSAFYSCYSLTDVYYTGTAVEWYSIEIGSDNDSLNSATIHFNNVPGVLPEGITPLEGSNLVVDKEKSLVSGIAAQSKPADVIAQFKDSDNIQIVGKDGTVLADDVFVGTGCKVQLIENSEVKDEVTVVIKGEIDGNGVINCDDVVYLLRNTLFASMYPVIVEDDVDGNGKYDSDDAVYLLKYILFPNKYPLK